MDNKIDSKNVMGPLFVNTENINTDVNRAEADRYVKIHGAKQ